MIFSGKKGSEANFDSVKVAIFPERRKRRQALLDESDKSDGSDKSDRAMGRLRGVWRRGKSIIGISEDYYRY